jgi:hypothetical protein
MRLFRQTGPGDWSDVIERVVEVLRGEEWTKKLETLNPKFETNPNDQIAEISKQGRFGFRIFIHRPKNPKPET